MRFLFAVLGLIVSAGLAAQNDSNQSFVRRYWQSLTGGSDGHGADFIVYPTVAFAPETSWEFGLSGLYLYHANDDTTNRLSEVNGFGFVTLENQWGLWLDHALYSDKDRWMALGRLRWQSFPLLYHGIGFNTPAEPLARVDARYLLWQERVVRKIKGNLFGGLRMDLQHLSQSNFVDLETEQAYPLPLGADGSFQMGLGPILLYDTRHNVLNVRKGLYSEWGFTHYDPLWGADYQFSSFLTETRWFYPVTAKQTLAFQFLGQFTQGEAPFNMMALMGGESLMRGYYLGRFRDRNLLATQVEYRFLPFGFSKRWGAAVFAGAGQVYPQWDQLAWRKSLVSAGGGLRFLIFPDKDIYTRLDIAFTPEGSGIYFFIGEAF